MKHSIKNMAVVLATALLLTACEGDDGAAGPTGPQGDTGTAGADGATGADGAQGPAGVPNAVTREDVLRTNANIAYASYGDSLIAAIEMRSYLAAFVADPTEENFADAKDAWLYSREPYGQTEVYRFRVGPIDALMDDGTIGEEGDGPEGAINAWPLGEALIDYVANNVDGDDGPEVASTVAGITGSIIEDTVTFPTIDGDVIRDNFELGGDERNVSSGYHAIEFLLWGQDLNGDGSGTGVRDNTPGQRPVTDYALDATCTNGPNLAPSVATCTRRGEYLLAAADLLIEDLEGVLEAWNPNGTTNHYASFVAGGDTSLALILEGMGRMSFGELAGERMNIALLTNSQEDEHSCFSDNTHRDIFLNAKGVQNAFEGEYERINGEIVIGAGVDDLLISEGLPELANDMRAALEDTMIKVSVIDQEARTGNPFDTQIQVGITEPNVSGAIAALSSQTDVLETVITGLNVTTGDLRQDTEEDI
ncbi:MAG: imelysin family protein [Pseudomonadota bacterium]